MAVCVAQSPPGFCAACFNSKLGKRFVDLGSAYDGPVIRDDAGVAQSIDDNIVCEDCVRDAALALELDENPTTDLERRVAAAEQDAREWRSYAEGVEAQYGRRPEPVKRGPGRPPRRPEPKPEPVTA